MRRKIAAAALGLALSAVTAVGVLATADIRYEGDRVCDAHKAWPDGTSLSDMHPYHFNFYTGLSAFAGDTDAACAKWASDQRASAIRGLRELGYVVQAPTQEAPQTNEIPEPTATLWVYLSDGRFGIDAQVVSHYTTTIDSFDLDVVVFSGVDNWEFCNTSAIFPGELSADLSCASPDISHTSIDRVNVEVSGSGFRTEHLACFKDHRSSEAVTVFGCNPR